MATQRKAASAQGSVANVNSDVVNFLLELADYEKNVNRHLHKFNAYRKAAHTIAKCPTAVTSGAEARKLEGVGDKIGKKIDEFLTTGKLAKLEKIRADPRNTAIAELTEVTGIGPAAAAQLVKDGITSVAELEKHTDRLNHHQRVGLKHYHDFKERIPRPEMQEMETALLAAAKKVDPQIRATVCGSYRRGAKSSGDVDCLIAHPSVTSTTPAAKGKQSAAARSSPLHRLVEELCSQGFVTDEISHGESKFAGVCRLPLKSVKRPRDAAAAAGAAAKKPKPELGAGADDRAAGADGATTEEESKVKREEQRIAASDAVAASASSGSGDVKPAAADDDSSAGPGEVRRFRRLDLRLIPYDQYACGVLYFTGSDMFNKQMRAEALDVGFTLNEYCLRPVGSTGVAGEAVAVDTERDVFDAIGKDYRQPSERNV